MSSQGQMFSLRWAGKSRLFFFFFFDFSSRSLRPLTHATNYNRHQLFQLSKLFWHLAFFTRHFAKSSNARVQTLEYFKRTLTKWLIQAAVLKNSQHEPLARDAKQNADRIKRDHVPAGIWRKKRWGVNGAVLSCLVACSSLTARRLPLTRCRASSRGRSPKPKYPAARWRFAWRSMAASLSTNDTKQPFTLTAAVNALHLRYIHKTIQSFTSIHVINAFIGPLLIAKFLLMIMKTDRILLRW